MMCGLRWHWWQALMAPYPNRELSIKLHFLGCMYHVCLTSRWLVTMRNWRLKLNRYAHQLCYVFADNIVLVIKREIADSWQFIFLCWFLFFSFFEYSLLVTLLFKILYVQFCPLVQIKGTWIDYKFYLKLFAFAGWFCQYFDSNFKNVVFPLIVLSSRLLQNTSIKKIGLRHGGKFNWLLFRTKIKLIDSLNGFREIQFFNNEKGRKIGKIFLKKWKNKEKFQNT